MCTFNDIADILWLGFVFSDKDPGAVGLGCFLDLVKLNGVVEVDLRTCELYA